MSTVSNQVSELPSLPESFDFFTPANIQQYKEYIKGNGRRDSNKSGGVHSEFYVHSQNTSTKPDIMLPDCYTKFGLTYADKADTAKYGGKYDPKAFIKKEEKAENPADKEKNKIPGLCYAFPLRQNSHLVPFVDAINEIGKREYSKHSMTLTKNGKFLSLASVEDVWNSVAKDSENKVNAEKYGPSIKIKIDNNTTFTKKSPCGKYDLPISAEEVFGKEGVCTVFGVIFKLNLEAKNCPCISFYANLIQFTPKVIGLGKANKYVTLPPKGYVPTEEAASKPAVVTPAPSSTVNVHLTSVSDANTTVVAASGNPDDDILGVTGKRKFVDNDE